MKKRIIGAILTVVLVSQSIGIVKADEISSSSEVDYIESSELTTIPDESETMSKRELVADNSGESTEEDRFISTDEINEPEFNVELAEYSEESDNDTNESTITETGNCGAVSGEESQAIYTLYSSGKLMLSGTGGWILI